MSDKGEVQHDSIAETPYPTPRRRFFARLKAHFKKWWWLHLIIFAAGVLIVALPFIYVGYPRIAQTDVNDATINVTSLIFTNPRPNVVHANQTQVLGNKAIYHPTIFAFNTSISLVGLAAPISWAIVPTANAEDGQVIIIDTDLPLSSEDAATQFTETLLNSASFQLNFYGTPDLKEGILPTTNVVFNKTVTMTGLNRLQGFSLSNVHVSLTPAPDGTNMKGDAVIPNPSVMTVEMGNVTLDLSVNGTFVGQSIINDFTLQPGNNNIPFTATVNQTTVINMIQAPNSPYKNFIIPIDITGNKSVYNGQEIPYYSKALASNTLSTTLNLTAALAS